MLSKDTRKKLFVTTAARQRLDTPDSFYEPVNNPKLLYEYPNAYPILSAVNGYVDEGDQVELLVIRMDPADTEGKETAFRNFQTVCTLVKELCQKKKAEFSFRELIVPDDESISTHFSMFERLIEVVAAEKCRIYMDLTYGTKPQMIPLFMTMNFVYQSKSGSDAEMMIYGNYNFQTKQKKIYDVTPLCIMDQIVNKLGARNIPADQTIEVIKSLISTDAE